MFFLEVGPEVRWPKFYYVFTFSLTPLNNFIAYTFLSDAYTFDIKEEKERICRLQLYFYGWLTLNNFFFKPALFVADISLV